jgi:ammonia channel protein AmtB
MLTMYNPNGVFIALEELGYLLMSLALAVLAPAFVRRNKVERTIRWLFVSSFALAVGALAAVSATRGIDRGYLFEIIVISIVWLTLIVAGPLVAVVLRRAPLRSPLPDVLTEDGA